MTSALPWYALLTPLLASTVIVRLTLRARVLSALISVFAVIVSFICACFVFTRAEIKAAEVTWIDFPGILRVPIAFTLDQLSKTMLVLVTGVGGLIHIYSLGYMRDDPGKSRYFASLSFFMFSMLVILIAHNFVS